jgi:hypothetical protein
VIFIAPTWRYVECFEQSPHFIKADTAHLTRHARLWPSAKQAAIGLVMM